MTGAHGLPSTPPGYGRSPVSSHSLAGRRPRRRWAHLPPRGIRRAAQHSGAPGDTNKEIIMWKKNEPVSPQSSAYPSPSSSVNPVSSVHKKEHAAIGPSIVIKGDLTGTEDLEIQGRLEGSITLESCDVSIGPKGSVKADIRARSIRVGGEVEGNLFGQEEVVIHKTGRVQGNITAARVTLENGSKFKGSIDMEPKSDAGARGLGASSSASSPSSKNGKSQPETTVPSSPGKSLSA